MPEEAGLNEQELLLELEIAREISQEIRAEREAERKAQQAEPFPGLDLTPSAHPEGPERHE